MLAFAERHDNVWASAGEHPGSTSASRSWLRAAWEAGDNSKIVALGEMGLDYFYTQEECQRLEEAHNVASLSHEDHAMGSEKAVVLTDDELSSCPDGKGEESLSTAQDAKNSIFRNVDQILRFRVKDYGTGIPLP